MTDDLYAVYGASGFGREVMPLARLQLEADGVSRERLVFIDDRPDSRSVNGHEVLTYQEFLARPARSRHVAIAIADAGARRRLMETCDGDGVRPWTIRHSTVVVMDDVQIGDGAILCPYVVLTSNVRIGRGFHANLYSYVAHDCVVGDFVTFAPAAKCNGNVRIQNDAYIGTGAILRQGKPGSPLMVGSGAIVGMGAVVTRDVAAGGTVVGNPARPLETKGTRE